MFTYVSKCLPGIPKISNVFKQSNYKQHCKPFFSYYRIDSPKNIFRIMSTIQLSARESPCHFDQTIISFKMAARLSKLPLVAETKYEVLDEGIVFSMTYIIALWTCSHIMYFPGFWSERFLSTIPPNNMFWCWTWHAKTHAITRVSWIFMSLV